MKQLNDVPYDPSTFRTKRTVPGVIKAFDAGEGILEGYASLMGVQDSYDEIVDKGAFKRSLKEHDGRIALCWQHDWHEVIGRIEELKEVPRSKLPDDLQEKYPEATGGLHFRSQVLDTRQGQDAKILLRAGAIKEMSIGFDLYDDSAYTDDDGITHLRHIRLYEISPVTMGANPGAQVVDYKGEVPPVPDLHMAGSTPGKKIYVKTGDGRWWARMWRGDEVKPTWEPVEEGDIPYGKPEETEDFISIPNPGVSDCDVTATITISEEEGIQARYCGKIKKVRTFIFAKAKGWTMAKAQKWVEDHQEEFKSELIISLKVALQLVLDDRVVEGYNYLKAIVSELPQPTLEEAEELILRACVLEAETSIL